MTFSVYRLVSGGSRICKCAAFNTPINFLRTNRLLSSNVRQNAAASKAYLACQGEHSKDSSSISEPEKSPVWTIPNALCGLRIAAAPFLGHFIIDHSYFTAIGILTVAGLTDLADGYIARNFKNQSSRLGTFLDPLADKVLIITLYSSLVLADLIPALLMGIIVFRDVLLLSAGMYIRYISIPPPRTISKYFDGSSSQAKLQPTYLSKVNTVLQIIIAGISLYAPTTTWISNDLLTVLWYTAGFSTVISGLSYLFSKNTFVMLKNSTKKSK